MNLKLKILKTLLYKQIQIELGLIRRLRSQISKESEYQDQDA